MILSSHARKDEGKENNASYVIKLNGEQRSVFLESDMVMSSALMQELHLMESQRRRKRWAYRDIFYPETIWEGGIPYQFDENLPAMARASLEYAMKFWQLNTCVTFWPRENETEYLLFTGENPGCFSTVGRDITQQVQVVNIGRGCYHFGVTTHEVGHALGLFHHQQRFDRDDYITFLKGEVPRRYWLNFAKISEKYLSTYGLPYDVGSIMHYTPTEFASNIYLPGLTTKDGNLQGAMGSMDGPSFLDVQIVNRHYKCLGACNGTEPQPKCLNGGYVDPRNCTICKCPSGFGGDVCQLISSSSPLKCGGLIPATSKLTRMRVRLTSTGKQRRQCIYHLRAPPNRRVMVGLQSVAAICQEGCFTTAVEMKMVGDNRPVGYRFCCESHSFRRILSKGRNVPLIFYARNSTLDVLLYFRWVVTTPDAEDATYLNSTQLAEIYKQSDEDSGVDMEVYGWKNEGSMISSESSGPSKFAKAVLRGRLSFDTSDYVGEYGSDGESYEDFSVYS